MEREYRNLGMDLVDGGVERNFYFSEDSNQFYRVDKLEIDREDRDVPIIEISCSEIYCVNGKTADHIYGGWNLVNRLEDERVYPDDLIELGRRLKGENLERSIKMTRTLKYDLLEGGIRGNYYASGNEGDLVYQVTDVDTKNMGECYGDILVPSLRVKAWHFDGTKREWDNDELLFCLSDRRLERFEPKSE